MAGVLLLELAAALCPDCGKSVRMASSTMMRCASANCTRCGASGCAVPAVSALATPDLARTDEPSKACSSSCTAAITTLTLYHHVHCTMTVQCVSVSLNGLRGIHTDRASAYCFAAAKTHHSTNLCSCIITVHACNRKAFSCVSSRAWLGFPPTSRADWATA